MSTVIFVTDIHGNKVLYEKLFAHAEKHDAELIIGGDICPSLHGTIEESIAHQRKFLVEYLLPRISELKKKPYLMMGNDDCRINLDVLKAQDGKALKLLHGKAEKLDKYFVYGYPYVPITPFHLKDWEKADVEAETVGGTTTVERNDYSTIRDDFRKIAQTTEPAKTIYSVHTPPAGTTLDILHDGRHVGSTALRQFIEKHQPALTLHGHIHESPGAEQLGRTLMVNPGSHHHPAKALPRKLPIAVFTTDNLGAVNILELS